MPQSSHVHTIRLPLRKICSALPAVALISGGIMLPASAAQAVADHLGAAAKNAPAIVVPDIAMTTPGSAQNETDPFPLPPPKGRASTAGAAPALAPLESMLPAGTVPGSSSPVTLDSTGIPVRALEAYRKAASLVGAADPGCHIDWALLGAIGRVESNHARFGGNQLDASGNARPGIIGVALDGSNGTARILDTDKGLLDRDTVYDRAVGPMQFIPSTWAFAGVDANGDGTKDPENMADAAAAACCTFSTARCMSSARALAAAMCGAHAGGGAPAFAASSTRRSASAIASRACAGMASAICCSIAFARSSALRSSRSHGGCSGSLTRSRLTRLLGLVIRSPKQPISRLGVPTATPPRSSEGWTRARGARSSSPRCSTRRGRSGIA